MILYKPFAQILDENDMPQPIGTMTNEKWRERREEETDKDRQTDRQR